MGKDMGERENLRRALDPAGMQPIKIEMPI